MAAGTHDLDLILQSSKTIFLSGQSLLGKSLHCILLSIFVTLDKIDGCKGSPSDLLEWAEELMEAELVDAAGEVFPPEEELLLVMWVAQFEGVVAFLEADGVDVVDSPCGFISGLLAK